MTATMDASRLGTQLRPPVGPWRRVEVHATLDSTNTRAAALGEPDVVVLAEEQTAGRGRLARSWLAPRYAALTVSATLSAPDGAPGWVPLVAGLAVRDAVAEVAGLEAVLKWPNDVLLPADGHRKVAGLLCEWLPGVNGEPALVVVGIGLNVRQARAELPVDTATSLALAGATGGGLDREALLVALLAALRRRYAAVQAGGPLAAGERAAYRAACASIGVRARLVRGAGELTGVVTGIDDEGALLLDAGDGRGPQAYAAGDVVHLRADAGEA
ncbi:MAG TPA: biotin--[acetyl-CoA-carboxylase] ligase [Dermatophilaceae bacterium]|nr:biotin--[acetyl-CoA-carboxylase] ligase [Dermatophilaceae bacterium]